MVVLPTIGKVMVPKIGILIIFVYLYILLLHFFAHFFLQQCFYYIIRFICYTKCIN